MELHAKLLVLETHILVLAQPVILDLPALHTMPATITHVLTEPLVNQMEMDMFAYVHHSTQEPIVKHTQMLVQTTHV